MVRLLSSILDSEPLPENNDAIGIKLTIDGQKKTKVFKKRDQFVPELTCFSDCIRENQNPQPAGEEGLVDVRIIRAL